MVIPISRLRDRSRLAVLLVLALFLRTAFALWFSHSMLQSPASDVDDYARFAHTLVTEGTYGPSADQPSAFRPPGYPLLLAPWSYSLPPRVWGVFAVHLLLSAGIVAFTWILAHLAGADEWAWLAALLVAVDPLLVHQTALIMSETLFTFLFCALLAWWLRGIPPIRREEPAQKRLAPFLRTGSLREVAMRLQYKRPIELSDLDQNSLEFYQRPPLRWTRRLFHCVLVGVVLGCAVLTRPIALPFWGLLLPAALVQRRFADWLGATLVAAACCLPWVARNVQQFDRPILTTTHGGYTLWLGHNPVYFKEVVAGPNFIWPADSHREWTQENAKLTTGMDELQRDRYFQKLALEWMRNNPKAALRSMIHHAASMWSPTPNVGPVGLRRLCLLFYLILFVLAAVGLCYQRIWITDLIVLPIAMLGFTMVHMVYWSNIRMRAPLEPLLAVLAAVAVQRFLPMKSRRGHKKRPWQ